MLAILHRTVCIIDTTTSTCSSSVSADCSQGLLIYNIPTQKSIQQGEATGYYYYIIMAADPGFVFGHNIFRLQIQKRRRDFVSRLVGGLSETARRQRP